MPTKQTLAGTTTVVPPSELRTYHKNPRRGDVGAIKASLLAHDQANQAEVTQAAYVARCVRDKFSKTLRITRHPPNPS